MLILGIDTSEKNINLCLIENNIILAELEKSSLKNEEIINILDDMFKNIGKTHYDLNGVGVITGPGGYTSTRAGVAVAKTLSQFLNIPIVGFTKIEAILLAYKTDKFICPMIDIKREEAYLCVAKVENNNIEYLSSSQVIKLVDLKDYLNSLNNEIILLNHGFTNNEVYFNNLSEKVILDSNFYLKPSHVAFITDEFIKSGFGKQFHEVSPFYIREAV
ncbi:MAG: tRNA (adenosine(37)-N6)-threonylcarbamoyltransferase complex dimerization subunit type 1 TsaB [Candidatus Sericytochromatia bacterium]|nr:tRNA (adenosine(37)-N6)-threonylcarbamoyltransferase complex dimerization subunit type 1 TsaB [Candidatus Sericytochromatia bacterium]